MAPEMLSELFRAAKVVNNYELCMMNDELIKGKWLFFISQAQKCILMQDEVLNAYRNLYIAFSHFYPLHDPFVAMSGWQKADSSF